MNIKKELLFYTNLFLLNFMHIYEDLQDPECRYINLTRDNRIIYLQGYNLFAFFWLTCFISGLTDMILAGAFASYYWAFDKVKDVPSFPILRSFGRVLR